MRIFKRAVVALVSLCFTTSLMAQVLPSTDLLTGSNGIAYGTANTWQNFSYNYTPGTSGSNYVGFAFRQDPAYWTMGNVSLTTGGGSNLLTNGNFATGGSFSITTNNGPGSVQAPQYWGVWYQNGTYPAAAGSWYAPGTGWNGGAYNGGQGVNTSTAGSWIDGAVGSFDGIYQGVNLTAGTTYSLSFTVYGNNATYSGAQLGVYAGVCADATVASNLCTMRSGTGFTTLATPSQGASAGNPSPTLVSSDTTNSVSTSTSNGATTTATTSALGTAVTVVALANSRQGQTSQALTVRQTATATTTTPVTYTTVATTPVTTTTTTTPVTTDTYSDGSTVVTNGTPVVTTSTADSVVTTTTTGVLTEVAVNNRDYTTRVDQYAKLTTANDRMNESLESDPWTRVRVDGGKISQRDLSGRDYNFYITGTGVQSSTKDTYSYTGNTFGLGIEKLLDPTVLAGVQYSHGQANLSGDQATGSLNKDAVGVYVVKSFDNDIVVKGDIGYAQNNYTNSHTLSALGLGNTGSANGYDSWAQVKAYTPAVAGFRAFVGGRSEANHINSVKEAGSAVSAMTYGAVNQTTNAGISGLRYDYNFTKKVAVGAEVAYYTNNVTNSTVNVTYHDEKNSSVLLKVGRQDYQGQATNIAQLQARVNF